MRKNKSRTSLTSQQVLSVRKQRAVLTSLCFLVSMNSATAAGVNGTPPIVFHPVHNPITPPHQTPQNNQTQPQQSSARVGKYRRSANNADHKSKNPTVHHRPIYVGSPGPAPPSSALPTSSTSTL